jgi:hypothetical protein|eukprot:SAG25_NODE_790_length_5301_cov_2.342176_3_plen_125_part_00
MDEVWHGKQHARSGRHSGTLLTECLALACAALYSRAEKRHLQDPENEDFKDDATQKRQVERFQEIMVRAAATVCISWFVLKHVRAIHGPQDATGKELQRTIKASIHVDTSVSIVTCVQPAVRCA